MDDNQTPLDRIAIAMVELMRLQHELNFRIAALAESILDLIYISKGGHE